MSRFVSRSHIGDAKVISSPRSDLGGLTDRRVGSLKANFLWTLFGNSVYAICQGGVLVVLAKLGKPEMVGQFSLSLALCSPVFIFANLSLRSVQATDIGSEFVFDDYRRVRLGTSCIALAAITTLAFLFIHDPVTKSLVIVMGVAKSVDSICDLYFGLFQNHERMEYIAIALIVNGVLSVVASAALLWKSDNVLIAGVGYASASLVAMLLCHVNSNMGISASTVRVLGQDRPGRELGRRVGIRQKYQAPLKLVRMTFSLGIAVGLVSLNSNIPRYFLAHFEGQRELGIFAAMAYFLVAGTTVVGALSQAAMPRMAKYYASNDIERFFRLLIALLVITAVLCSAACAVVAVWGRDILTITYGKEYGYKSSTFLWLAIASSIGFISWHVDTAIVAVRKFNAQLPITVATVLTTACASGLLISRYGINGAAAALICGATVQATLRVATLARVLVSREARKRPGKIDATW